MSGDVLFGNNLYTTSGSTRTISDMMATMRTKVIEMGEGEHGTVGGSASSLTVLDKEKDGIDGFFSERKVINRDIDAVAEEFLENAFKEKNIDAKKALLIKEGLGALPPSGREWEWFDNIYKEECYKKDAEIKAFVDDMAPKWMAIGTSHLNAFDQSLANLSSDSFDSNARNVATSRIAELFGVGRLVAKSEMAELRKKGQNTGKLGSVMEKAKGEVAAKVVPRVLAEALQKKDLKSEDGKRELKWKACYGDGFQEAMIDTMKELITGDFMRDMSDLQVLDYLCGQIDRHGNNYFITLNEEGRLGSVQGIDNDLSFGNAQHGESRRNALGSHGRRVVSDEGDLFIPHMSRSFAEAIDAVDETMVRFVLADLLEASDINAFCQRLAAVKKAVRKELQKKPEESKLLGDDEWKDNMADDFRNTEDIRGQLELNSLSIGNSNYVGRELCVNAISDPQKVYNHYRGQDK